MDQTTATLSKLPVRTRPAYSLRVLLVEVGKIRARVDAALEPSIFRRLLGGVSKDHARSVVAAGNADLAAASRAARRIQVAADEMALAARDGEDGRIGAVISGYCERLLKTMLDWASVATDFESNVFGSGPRLAAECVRLGSLLETLEPSLSRMARRH